MRLVLSITHKGDRRIENIELTGQPITIGRGWDSDVVLEDKYIDAHHIRLSFDQEKGLLVSDLASLNGTLVDKHRLGSEPQPLALGSVLTVGDTHIRVYDRDRSATPPATVRSAWFLLSERCSKPLGLLLITLGALFSDGLVSQMTSAAEFDFKDLATELTYLLVMSLGLVLFMGLISKLVRKEMNLKAHWVLLMVGTIVFHCAGFLIDVLRFNLQAPELSTFISTLLFGGVGAALLVGFFSFSTHLSSRLRWLWALSLVGLVVLSSYSDQWRQEDHEAWSDSSATETVTLPKWLLFRTVKSVAQHQAKTESLFEFDLEQE